MTASRSVTDFPPSLLAVESACAEASRRIHVIRAATPLNFEAEIERATASVVGRRAVTPRFEYRAPPLIDDLARALDEVADIARREGPWGDLHAARAAELSLEARLVGRVGARDFGALAASRYAHAVAIEAETTVLARAWLETPTEAAPARVRSDDEGDPRSLVREMRRVIARHRLSVRVVVVEHLAALAAVGDGVVYIARDRTMTEDDVARTVLHEVEGHLIPLARAQRSARALYRFGTARGSDGQEGYALSLERRHGFLRDARRRELALRHLAASALHAGAPCSDVIVDLVARGGGVRETVRATLRAHRGGVDGKGGLGRERAYLPSLLCAERLHREDPRAFGYLSRGRVGIDAARALATLDVGGSREA